MRFSDIKKFWETRLGGQTSKTPQVADGSANKNGRRISISPSKKSNAAARKRSIKDQAAKYDVSYSQEKTSANSPSHDDDSSSIDVMDKKGFHAPLINGLEAEGNTKAIGVIAFIDNNYKDKGEKKRTSFTLSDKALSGKADGKEGNKAATGSNFDLASEKLVIADQPVSSSTESSPKKIWSLRKNKYSPELVSSDNHLNKLSSKSGQPNNLASISAPPSVHSSPLKTMKTNDNARYHSRSNVKFNEVQNFWMTREKKLVRRSVDERRCFVCGCNLNNYFYEQDNALYCEEDYWSKFGHCCRKCNGIITGPIMIAGLHRFHPECFSCHCCKRCISDGDLYALLLFEQTDTESPMESLLLFCHCCYEGLLSQHTLDINDISKTAKCSVIHVVLFVPDQSDVIHQQQGADSSRQSCSKGYGLSVKDLPINLSTDNNNQPVGQLVCGVDVKENCSLLVGDLLLQVNGLAVDLNALDLIDRLYDDSGSPLQLTIQREVSAPTDMLFGDYTCTHANDVAFLSNSLDLDYAPEAIPNGALGSDLNGIVAKEVILNDQPCRPTTAVSEQPKIPVLSSSRIDADAVRSVSSAASCTDGSAVTYCSPFSSLSSNPLCCDGISNHEPSLLPVQSGPNGEIEIGDLDINDVFHDTPQSSSVTIQEISRMKSSSSAENIHVDTNNAERQFHISNALSSDVKNEINDLQSRRKSDVSIVVSHSTTPRLNGTEATSIIHNNESSVALSPVLLSNEESDDHNELQNGPDVTHAISKPLPCSSSRSIPDDSIPDFIAPSVSPRSKRLALKRKSLTITEQSRAPTSPTEAQCVKEESARRSNSLRHNAPVTMRRFSPRGRLHSPRILSVYNSEQVDDIGGDLSRSESMRVHGLHLATCPRVFRPCDLIHGEVLGQGFFGKAIKVTHRDTGEVMVLKVLNSLEEDIEKSFLKEVKVMRNLVHRNVIHFIGVLYKDRRLNIITEFVENGTLKDVIKNMEKELTWPDRVHIAYDISCGMSYLHSKNLIHRDLNSGNCFVKKNGVVVVADFGLARVHSKASSLGRRKRYTVVGNPYWMAPEMLYGRDYDERVDIFSFGIVLCEVIGRVDADPDFLPRSDDFGLAVISFHDKFCDNCPAFFFSIAVHACSLDPDNRPSFKVVEEWFQLLTLREEMARLPEPPNLHEFIISVYDKYNLPLPSNLYAPFVETQDDLPGSNHSPPSSSNHPDYSSDMPSVDSGCAANTDLDRTHSTFASLEQNSPIPIRGTAFYSDYSVTSRL